MRRREFISLLGGMTALPLVVRAQEVGKVYRIGFFGPALLSPANVRPYQAFLAQMRELGFREGQNLHIEFRGIVDDLRGNSVSAEELVRAQPELIVACGPAVPLQSVVGTNYANPIVMIAFNFDPIVSGYVKSLSRPGGNITGVVSQQLELAQKQVELLTQTFPGKTHLAILFEAQSADQFGAAERAAKSLKLEVQSLKLEGPSYDFDAAIRSAAAGGAQMLLMLSAPRWAQHRSRIAELAIQHRLPAMYIAKHYVEGGGLISYGADLSAIYRKGADYVAKILKGAKPADLPVEQAIKFELAVNLKSAKALGVTIPNGILLAADELIE
jgi:putative tryptophan/tyrosine transport system substrate-binding protein